MKSSGEKTNLRSLAKLCGDLQSPYPALQRVAKSLGLILDPHNARSHYNLADTLDEMRRYKEAAEHWRLYLSADGTSWWAQHARSRLASH